MTIYLWPGVCGLIGVALIGFALKHIIETVIFLRASRKTDGRVIYLDHSQNSDGKKMFMPVVEFRSAGKRVVRFSSRVASNPPAYSVGDTVEVRYLVKNPQAARINSLMEMWIPTLILLCIGIVFLIIGFFILISK